MPAGIYLLGVLSAPAPCRRLPNNFSAMRLYFIVLRSSQKEKKKKKEKERKGKERNAADDQVAK